MKLHIRHACLSGALMLSLLSAVTCKKPEPLPHLTVALVDAKGNTTTIGQWAGKPIVVNFWATWCLPCKLEMPAFNAVYREYKDRGVQFVGVSIDEGGWKAVDAFLEKVPVDYLVVIDTDGAIAKAFGDVVDLPTTIFIDAAGKITYRRPGLFEANALRKTIDSML